MKLLFDQNISHRLVASLQQEFPGSQHVREVGLRDATDIAVWQFAARNGFAILTKDADHQRSFLFGHPPKSFGFDWGIVQPLPSKRYLAVGLKKSLHSFPIPKARF